MDGPSTRLEASHHEEVCVARADNMQRMRIYIRHRAAHYSMLVSTHKAAHNTVFRRMLEVFLGMGNGYDVTSKGNVSSHGSAQEGNSSNLSISCYIKLNDCAALALAYPLGCIPNSRVPCQVHSPIHI